MSDESERRRSTAPRPCSVCGQQFSPRWPKGTYCSPECRGKANAARRLGTKHGGPSKIDIAPPKNDG